MECNSGPVVGAAEYILVSDVEKQRVAGWLVECSIDSCSMSGSRERDPTPTTDVCASRNTEIQQNAERFITETSD